MSNNEMCFRLIHQFWMRALDEESDEIEKIEFILAKMIFQQKHQDLLGST